MLSEWLPLAEKLEHAALISRDEACSWRELVGELRNQSQALATWQGQRVGLVLSPTVTSITRFLSLASAGIHTYLIATNTPEDQLHEWAKDLGLACLLHPDGSKSETDFGKPSRSPADGSTKITILTSGTTGKPKAVEHTWNSLVRPVRQGGASNPIWLLTYRPHLYAGLQVMLQFLLNYGTLVLPTEGAVADDLVSLAVENGVEFASATPSYWRWLMTTSNRDLLGQVPLKQITLGGEAVDQSTLDALAGIFPKTRLVHIYATTELGRCFSVTDGRAGFPKRFLEQISADGIEMKIDDGELVVRSANAMSGYDRTEMESPQVEWFRTSDLVRVDDDRVFFVGRKTDMINVGGNKVYPLEVERVIRSVDGVADTRVYAETSSIVGELVKCDLVVQPGSDPDEVEKAVRAATLANLQDYQCPRFISVVDHIPRTDAGKTNRN